MRSVPSIWIGCLWRSALLILHSVRHRHWDRVISSPFPSRVGMKWMFIQSSGVGIGMVDVPSKRKVVCASSELPAGYVNVSKDIKRICKQHTYY